MKLPIEVPLDDEGFLGLKCPTCGGVFKLTPAAFEDRTWQYLTCPLCGIARGPSRFHSREVVGAAMAKARAALMGEIDAMAKRLERATRGQLVKFKRVPHDRVRVPRLRAITDLVITELPCCRDQVKLPLAFAASLFYCPLCGQAQD